MATTWRARVHALLDETETRSVARRAVNAALIAVTIGSVIAVVLETLDWLAAAAGRVFGLVEATTVVVRIVAVLPRFPAMEGHFVLADQATVTALLDQTTPGSGP